MISVKAVAPFDGRRVENGSRKLRLIDGNRPIGVSITFGFSKLGKVFCDPRSTGISDGKNLVVRRDTITAGVVRSAIREHEVGRVGFHSNDGILATKFIALV